MKTLTEWAEAHGVKFVGRSAGVYTTGTVSAAALDEIFAEADALRRERDELAARLEAIERAEPTGWKVVPAEPTPGMIDAADSVDWRDDDTRGSVINMWHCMLAAAPERADGCGACGDSCRSRGSCRLADESPTPAARPCRCGPDGCSDSTSCPRGER